MPFKRKQKSSASYDNPEALFRDRRNRTIPGLLSHQSDILRRYQEEAFDKPNVAIELPTGSGKTLVGLLIAEFRRITKKERVLYLCPTNQLVQQVCEQSSRKYGITATPFVGQVKQYSPTDKASYQTGETIAVSSYSALFNINPFFDTPNLIILDDAHAAENYISSTWSLNINRFDDENRKRTSIIYSGLLSILERFLPSVTANSFKSSTSEKTQWIEKIPTVNFREVLTDVEVFLSENIAPRSPLSYPWSFLKGNLQACHVYISWQQILIRPYIPPSLTHQPFKNAVQRIFMSATLGLSGDLERTTGIPDLHRLPAPEGWDKQGIGRRYFIFPGMSLPEEEIDELIKLMAQKAKRALILVPSDSRLDKYNDLFESFSVYTARDIESSKDEFIGSEQSVAILANRYDGIDLVDNDCRLLIVENVPKSGNLQELFLLNRASSGNLLKDRTRTRIIQAFGRCTRNATDYAAVVIIGDGLYDWLTLNEKRSLFHPELQGEIQFGIEQSKDSIHNDFLETLNIFLEHGNDWNEVDKDILEYRDESVQEKLPGQSQLAEAAKLEVEYLYSIWNKNYEKSLEYSQKVAELLSGGDELKGLRGFWYYLAASSAELAMQELGQDVFKMKSAELYRKASACLPALSWLYSLSSKLSQDINSPYPEQDIFLESNIERIELLFESKSFASLNKFESYSKEVLEDLDSEDSKRFESAHQRLGEMLGFDANNSNADATPDPWWISNGKLCLVSEDKSDSNPNNSIPPKHVRQAASHREWIQKHISLGENFKIYTVMITTQSKIHPEGPTFAQEVGYWHIDDFRQWAREAINVLRELRASFTGVGQAEWRDTVREKLKSYHLDPKAIIELTQKKLLKDLDIE